VIEAVAMENKMVSVDAAAMAKEVAATGHIALYGILFDTDKTDIKPESVAALDEIAKFLKADAKVGVYIVGHTDNVGGFEHNMSLSLRRAEAVVKELTTKYGIPAGRLKAVGTGPAVPLAPNDTEEGRATNRHGVLDLGLTIGWIYCFAAGKWIFGTVFLVADLAHALVVTIMLLTGNFRDGEGRRVCYPGQQLTSR
jgi:hypothetical protein